MYDKNNTKILETTEKYFDGRQSKEFTINDDERIIGVKSRKYSTPRSAWHFDF